MEDSDDPIKELLEQTGWSYQDVLKKLEKYKNLVPANANSLSEDVPPKHSVNEIDLLNGNPTGIKIVESKAKDELNTPNGERATKLSKNWSESSTEVYNDGRNSLESIFENDNTQFEESNKSVNVNNIFMLASSSPEPQLTCNDIDVGDIEDLTEQLSTAPSDASKLINHTLNLLEGISPSANDIKPTKTNDVTKIKGWKKKKFAIAKEKQKKQSEKLLQMASDDFDDIQAPKLDKELPTLDLYLTENDQLNISYEMPKLEAEQPITKTYTDIKCPEFAQESETRPPFLKSKDIYKPKTLAKKRKMPIKSQGSQIKDFMVSMTSKKQKDYQESVSNMHKTLIEENIPFTRRCFVAATSIINAPSFVVYNGRRYRVPYSKTKQIVAKIKDRREMYKSVTIQPFKKYKEFNRYPKKSSLLKSLKAKVEKKEYNPDEWKSVEVKLPKLSLEVIPEVGKCIDPKIEHLINFDHTITQDRIDFALGVLKTKNWISNLRRITFPLAYANNEDRMIMRKPLLAIVPRKILMPEMTKTDSEMAVNKLLDYIEISECSKDLLKEDHCRSPDLLLQQEEKAPVKKRKRGHKPVHRPKNVLTTNLEMQRLNRKRASISLDEEHDENKPSRKKFYKLRCISKSIESNKRNLLSNHCGLPDIGENISLSMEPDIFSQGIVNRLQDEAKKDLPKVKKNIIKPCFVKLLKHDLSDIIPLCMVHMLYKCHCKNKSVFHSSADEANIVGCKVLKAPVSSPSKPHLLKQKTYARNDKTINKKICSSRTRGFSMLSYIARNKSLSYRNQLIRSSKKLQNDLESYLRANSGTILGKSDEKLLPQVTPVEEIHRDSLPKKIKRNRKQCLVLEDSSENNTLTGTSSIQPKVNKMKGLQKRKTRSNSKHFEQEFFSSAKKIIPEPLSRDYCIVNDSGDEQPLIDLEVSDNNEKPPEPASDDTGVQDKITEVVVPENKEIMYCSVLEDSSENNTLTGTSSIQPKVNEMKGLQKRKTRSNSKHFEQEFFSSTKKIIPEPPSRDYCSVNDSGDEQPLIDLEVSENNEKPPEPATDDTGVQDKITEVVVPENKEIMYCSVLEDSSENNTLTGTSSIQPKVNEMKGLQKRKTRSNSKHFEQEFFSSAKKIIPEPPSRDYCIVNDSGDEQPLIDLEVSDNNEKPPEPASDDTGVQDKITEVVVPENKEIMYCSVLEDSSENNTLTGTSSIQPKVNEMKGLQKRKTRSNSKHFEQEFFSSAKKIIPEPPSRDYCSVNDSGDEQPLIDLEVSENNEKPPEPASDDTGVQHKITEVVVPENKEIMYCSRQCFQPKKLISESADDVLNIQQVLSASIPSITLACKWRVICMDLEFAYLSLARSSYTIKYDDIMEAVKSAQTEKITIILKSEELQKNYPHCNFGIYCVENYLDKIFVGPYLLHENHDLNALNFVNGVLVNTNLSNEIEGGNVPGSGFWFYQATKSEIFSEMIDLTCSSDDELPGEVATSSSSKQNTQLEHMLNPKQNDKEELERVEKASDTLQKTGQLNVNKRIVSNVVSTSQSQLVPEVNSAASKLRKRLMPGEVETSSSSKQNKEEIAKVEKASDTLQKTGKLNVKNMIVSTSQSQLVRKVNSAASKLRRSLVPGEVATTSSSNQNDKEEIAKGEKASDTRQRTRQLNVNKAIVSNVVSTSQSQLVPKVNSAASKLRRSLVPGEVATSSSSKQNDKEEIAKGEKASDTRQRTRQLNVNKAIVSNVVSTSQSQLVPRVNSAASKLQKSLMPGDVATSSSSQQNDKEEIAKGEKASDTRQRTRQLNVNEMIVSNVISTSQPQLVPKVNLAVSKLQKSLMPGEVATSSSSKQDDKDEIAKVEKASGTRQRTRQLNVNKGIVSNVVSTSQSQLVPKVNSAASKLRKSLMPGDVATSSSSQQNDKKEIAKGEKASDTRQRTRQLNVNKAIVSNVVSTSQSQLVPRVNSAASKLRKSLMPGDVATSSSSQQNDKEEIAKGEKASDTRQRTRQLNVNEMLVSNVVSTSQSQLVPKVNSAASKLRKSLMPGDVATSSSSQQNDKEEIAKGEKASDTRQRTRQLNVNKAIVSNVVSTSQSQLVPRVNSAASKLRKSLMPGDVATSSSSQQNDREEIAKGEKASDTRQRTRQLNVNEMLVSNVISTSQPQLVPKVNLAVSKLQKSLMPGEVATSSSSKQDDKDEIAKVEKASDTLQKTRQLNAKKTIVSTSQYQLVPKVNGAASKLQKSLMPGDVATSSSSKQNDKEDIAKVEKASDTLQKTRQLNVKKTIVSNGIRTSQSQLVPKVSSAASKLPQHLIRDRIQCDSRCDDDDKMVVDEASESDPNCKEISDEIEIVETGAILYNMEKSKCKYILTNIPTMGYIVAYHCENYVNVVCPITKKIRQFLTAKQAITVLESALSKRFILIPSTFKLQCRFVDRVEDNVGPLDRTILNRYHVVGAFGVKNISACTVSVLKELGMDENKITQVLVDCEQKLLLPSIKELARLLKIPLTSGPFLECLSNILDGTLKEIDILQKEGNSFAHEKLSLQTRQNLLAEHCSKLIAHLPPGQASNVQEELDQILSFNLDKKSVSTLLDVPGDPIIVIDDSD